MMGTAEERIQSIKDITGLNSTVGIVNITPDMARNLLVYNTNNRRLSDGIVKKYANQMLEGKWKDDASMICFSTTGELSNGQHRLNAIIRSNKTIKFVVALNIDNFAEMDRGKGRTITDNISTDYRFRNTEIGNSADIQHIASMTVKILKNQSKTYTDDAIAILEKYGDTLLLLKHESVLIGPRNMNNKAVSVAILVAYVNGTSLELLKRFRRVLTSGIAEDTTDAPIIALRDKLLKLKGGGYSIEKDRYKMTLYCIESLKKGLTRKTCRSVEPCYTLLW